MDDRAEKLRQRIVLFANTREEQLAAISAYGDERVREALETVARNVCRICSASHEYPKAVLVGNEWRHLGEMTSIGKAPRAVNLVCQADRIRSLIKESKS